MGFIGFIISILGVVGVWKLYEKADEPGWAAIVPIYNTWVMAKIAGINPIMILLLLIPLVNVIYGFYLTYKFVESYGFGMGGFLLYVFIFPVMAMYMGFSTEVHYTGTKY